MYVPPLHSLLRELDVPLDAFQKSDTIPIPVSLFRFLLQTALANAEFNQDGYLAANADIASGIKSGTVDDAHLHYIGFGYFEGRKGGLPAVDEQWYLSTYKDVAEAVKVGRVTSAADHFEMIGAAEGRSPTQNHTHIAEHWRRLFTAAAASDSIAEL